jgi:hypothetical protein
MRQEATRERVIQLMEALGRLAQGPGRIYIVGGSSMVLLDSGRESTIDIDLKLDPEPLGIFQAIAKLKISMNLNIELAAPDQFIPALPDWQERSKLIKTVGQVEFRHYDFYGQALAKIERGHDRDLKDVTSLVENQLIKKARLKELFAAIEEDLIRYPSINILQFTSNVINFCEE